MDALEVIFDKEVTRLIDLYCELISWDHHKNRDGIFLVELRYNAWDKNASIYVLHPGYCDEWQANVLRLQDAREFIIQKVKENIREEISAMKENGDIKYFGEDRVKEIYKEVFNREL